MNVISVVYPLPFDNSIRAYIDQDNSRMIFLVLKDLEVIADSIPASISDGALLVNNEECITLAEYNKALKVLVHRDPVLAEKLVDLHTDSILRYTEQTLQQNDINVTRENNSHKAAIEQTYCENWGIGQSAIADLVQSLKVGKNYTNSWQQQVTQVINKTIDGRSTSATRRAVSNNNYQWVSQTNNSRVRAIKGKARKKLAEYITIYEPQTLGDLKALAEKAAIDVKQNGGDGLSVKITI